jgi:hypothetical protein
MTNEFKHNTNCLSGMRCPECSALGPFKLMTKGPDPVDGYGMGQMELYRAVESGDVEIVEYTAEWEDDGSIDTVGDTEFVEDGDGECISCGYEGAVNSFRG